MSVYLDASVLVSLFILDPTTARADRAFRGRMSTWVIGDFTAAEFASAIGRRVRMRELTEQEARVAFVKFDQLAPTPERIETLPRDIRAAEAVLRGLDLTLRTPDALHIAIAQRIGAELATFDMKLAESARVLGAKISAI